MYIGICEDDEQDSEALRILLAELRPGDTISVFSDAAGLFDALCHGSRFDLLFLDIYLPDGKGTDLARTIRKQFSQRKCHIVFTTTSSDYAVEAFALRADHYIVKPVRHADLVEILKRVTAPPELRSGITVRANSTTSFHYLDEIAFCQSIDHKLMIHLKSGEVLLCYQSLSEMQEQTGNSFLLISRGLLVNPDYIAKMSAKTCLLKDGQEVLLSRRNQKKIHDAYNRFLFSKLLDR